MIVVQIYELFVMPAIHGPTLAADSTLSECWPSLSAVSVCSCVADLKNNVDRHFHNVRRCISREVVL